LTAILRFRRSETRRRCLAAALLGVVVGPGLLAGCGSMSIPFFGSKSAKPATSAQACPTAAVLRPLSSTAVFGPSVERRPINVAYYGILSDVTATCSTNGNAVQVALDIVIAAERGPAAAAGDGVDLYYFVAVTGPNNGIISKNPFSVHIPVSTGQKRGGVTDHIEEVIDTGGRPLTELNIVVGFQQTPDVVDFYKNFRGR
jgi:hypothetical protein